jgi:hypothetical protein
MEQFTDIFEKLETLPLAAVTSTKPLGPITEVWEKRVEHMYASYLGVT